MPLPYSPVLKRHVEGKAVEKDEDGDINPIHKSGRGTAVVGAGPKVQTNNRPRYRSGQAAHPVAEPIGAFGSLIVYLHNEPAEVHDSGKGKDSDEATQVVDAYQHGDGHHHDGS